MAEQSLISSERWLQLHGLKSKNKLTLKQILAQIGFPQSEGTVHMGGRREPPPVPETAGLCLLACWGEEMIVHAPPQ